MSYILEALKKSENERGRSGTPTFQTVHTSSLQYQQQRHGAWPYLLAAVVVINLGVLAYLVYDRESAPAGQIIVDSTAGTDATQQAAATNTATQDTNTPASTAITQMQVSRAAPAPPVLAAEPAVPVVTATPTWEEPVTAEPAPVEARPARVRTSTAYVAGIDELPVDMQASIPDMVFSAHVYSSNPSQRSVVINDDFMEEGDMLTNSIRLQEITADGVIMDLDGRRFRSSVVSNWNIN